ncbi:RNA-binding S4 domain-containing protein [Erythrobacteraceae bacterium CFH 75059]|nr:RNA-binding S4 domain-containing protein [Erythrobacteraceae bacterium CFH 75059]
MRVDLLLCRLRFARTRSTARHMVENTVMRCNGAHVARTSHLVRVGDVLTFMAGDGQVRVVQILALPLRRGPAAEAQTHYRPLDRSGQSAIAPGPITRWPKDQGS